MIFVIWGFPGGGKSYYATKLAYGFLLKHRKVFTNYPIYFKRNPSYLQRFLNIFRKKNNKHFPVVYSSYVWRSEYLNLFFSNSEIIIDESYVNFNSKDWQNFGIDDHVSIATNRHNDNNFYFIAQNPARILKAIREMCNVFYCLKCWTVLKYPVLFRIEGYLDENSINARYNNPAAVYSRNYFRFKKKIGKSYDTKFYRKKGGPEIEYQTWFEKAQIEN